VNFWCKANSAEFLHTKLQVFTPLYRGVRETLWISSASKRVVWSFVQSPMIFCLIWLLSYEGSISNSFQVWRDSGADVAVFLVLLQGQNRVVEIVVVQFVQLSFVNALERTSIQCFQILSNRRLLHSFSLLQCWTRSNHE